MACASTSSATQSDRESLEDCMCTICLCILIHPVTLPCGHELCMPCFKQNVEEASLTCPLCRTRISTWARKASRTNSLVDQKRWEQIQTLFPQRVQRRLEGQDDETDEEIQEKEDVDVSYRRMVQLSQPGEIRKEYEQELQRLRAQQAAERREEEEASITLIQRLHSQEEQALIETRRQQEEIAARDSQLAQELGKLINTVESETPVNRLLQESRGNYPNVPLPPSTPTTPSSLFHESNDKGRQTLVKNNNKTLETFFRRLPAAGKRTARSASEPQIRASHAGGGKNCVGVAALSPRCHSAPVRDKENLPMVPDVSFLHLAPDVTHDTCFYEDLQMGLSYTKDSGSIVENEETGSTSMTQKGRVEIVDDAGVKEQGGVEIVDLCTGEQDRDSASTVHSDGSESVIVCGGPQEAGSSQVNEDPHFRPIQSSPRTPTPQTRPNPVPLEPCVVRITPRILFSTDCLSSATFPIVPSPVVSRATVSLRFDSGHHQPACNAADCRETPSEDGTCANSQGQAKGQNRTGEEMGSAMNGLSWQRDQDSGDSKESTGKLGQTASSVQADPKLRSRRAKSASPSALHCLPRSRLPSEEGGGKREFCRPSLKESRWRRQLQSLMEDVVSDSELSSPTPCYRLRPGRLAAQRLVRKARGERRKETRMESEKTDWKSGEQSSDSEDEGHPCLSIVSTAATGSTVSSPRHNSVSRSVVQVRLEDVTSAQGSVDGKAGASPPYTESSPGEDPRPSTSLELGDEHPMPHEQCSMLSKPAGAYSPDPLPASSQGLDSDEIVSGKGKRLLKKSIHSSLSHRNCPKSSGKTSSVIRSQEEGPCTGSDRSKAPRSPQVLPHTTLHEKQDSPRTRCRIFTTTLNEGARHTTSSTRPVASAAPDSDSDGLVRRVKRPDKNRTRLGQRPDPTKRQQRIHRDPSAEERSETGGSDDRAGRVGRKTSQKAAADQRLEVSSCGQRSIKHWFSPHQPAGSSQMPTTQLSRGQRKTPNKTQGRMLKSSALELEPSSANSSAATSPEKTGMRISQRARKINPRLEDFLLTVTKKLSQFRADSHAGSGTTPIPSQSEGLATPTLTTTPTKTLKRKVGGSDSVQSPAKKSRKHSPHPSPGKLPRSSSGDSARHAQPLPLQDHHGRNKTRATQPSPRKDHHRSDKTRTAQPSPQKDHHRSDKTRTAQPSPQKDHHRSDKTRTAQPSPQKDHRRSDKTRTALPSPLKDHHRSDKTRTALPSPLKDHRGSDKTRTAQPSPLKDFRGSDKTRTSQTSPRKDLHRSDKTRTAQPSPSKDFRGSDKTRTAQASPLKDFCGSDKSRAAQPSQSKDSNGGDKITTGQTPQKQAFHGVEGEALLSDEEEEEEGMSQEERDRRLALRLQEQFDLADKLNLNVVRFKGTNDQYSLRRGCSHSKE